MRKHAAIALTVAGVVGTVAIGFSVAALASSHSVAGRSAGTSETSTSEASTSEASTSETSTTEHAMSIAYKAKLTARAEVPKPHRVRVGARGTFTLTLTDTAGKYTAKWKLSFRKLTGKATAAHIHRGKAGKTGPVLVPLCGPCRSGQVGRAKLSLAAARAIKRGAAYVNVHTAKNPAGEIRAQVKKKKKA